MSWGRYVALVISRLFIFFAVLIGVRMALTESGEHSGGGALLLVALGVYFIPWFVALGRKHHNTPAIFLPAAGLDADRVGRGYGVGVHQKPHGAP